MKLVQTPEERSAAARERVSAAGIDLSIPELGWTDQAEFREHIGRVERFRLNAAGSDRDERDRRMAGAIVWWRETKQQIREQLGQS